MQCLISFIGYLVFLSLLVSCSSGKRVHVYMNISTDLDALLAFKNHIKSPNNLFSNWSLTSSSSVCQWVGVTCGSHHHRVIGLNVSYMGLFGTIPPQLENISFLSSLDISGNHFHGELPNQLSHLRRLKLLNFSVNNFTGEISFWIGFLSKLETLYLKTNSFTGLIPTSMFNLSNLEHIWLSFNSLQGSIPKGVGNLHNLKRLIIDYNHISGRIPYEIFNISTLDTLSLVENHVSGSLPEWMCNRLRKLNWLNLSSNKLNGQIPYNLSQCVKLQVLGLSNNQLSGFIPKEIGSLKALQYLYIGNSNLEGQILAEMGNLTNLLDLYLADNKLSGPIPREFGNLYHLNQVSLFNNSLSGSIPMEIFNLSFLSSLELSINNLSGNLPSPMWGVLPNLKSIYLYANNLEGSILDSISNCSNLQFVELSKNNFVGSIPNSLENLRLLKFFNIEGNQFTYNNFPSLELDFINFLTNCKDLGTLNLGQNKLMGYLPKSVGNLSTSLRIFNANDCKIQGKIPEEFENLTSLISLDLSGNQLVGSIPETFESLQQLTGLYLHNNKLDKATISRICGLQNLDSLYLYRNQISEPIPKCLANLTSLRYIYLDSNRLVSTIPASLLSLKDLLQLNLSTNFLSGYLPHEIGSLKVITLLDLSVNNFSSEIPSSIGDLQNLEYLSLAFNRFQGSIPKSLGKIISLDTLDLSHNNLSGIIPITLETLQYLKYFNVSFNSLSGEIPSQGPFQSLTSESFIFNKALCGIQKFHVPPCPKISPPKTRNRRGPLLVFILLGSLAIVVCAMAIVYVCFRCIRKGKVLVPRMTNLSYRAAQERFTYYKLAYATNGFSESNLLGNGSFGYVYKGTIDEQRIVAIKVFNPEVQGAFKSFNKECEILRNIRHKNLTKVISNCSMLDFKALVLEFMPNGSVEKWFYSHNYFLNIMQRLNIMIDVANALEYLHNGCMTPVVHCDLKPSNILLDEDMVAHVSDFGMSRFLDQEDSITYTQTIATFGYVAPEYGSEGLVSTISDVYSYGIMMMEVFTRIKPTNEMFCGNFNLRSWVKDSMPSELFQVLDANVLCVNDVNFDQKMECLHAIMKVALNCTKESPRERSQIKDVLAILGKIKLQMLTITEDEAN